MTSNYERTSRLPDIPVNAASPMPLGPRPSYDEPALHPFVERVWARLPQAYRVMDIHQGYTLKRMLAGFLAQHCALDDTVAQIYGARPIGPSSPEPSTEGMSPVELAHWRNQRRSRPSALADPYSAHAEWLAWLAQHVGVELDPSATLQERRDMVRYGTSGWHAGTEPSMAYAARSALTGSRFSRVIRGWRPDIRETGLAPTMWDITVVTRTSETPDPAAVLATISRKGCTPAGAVLHHKAYEAPWKVIEALRPTWRDWERTRSADNSFHATSWTELEETGLTFADVPGQLFRNASFEDVVAPWVANGGSIEHQVGGIDGFGAARLTGVGSVSAAYERVNLVPEPQLDTTIGDWLLATPRSGITKPAILDLANTIRPYQGEKYGRFILTGNAQSNIATFDAGVYASTFIPIVAGVPYRLLARVNSSGGRTGSAFLNAFWYDANGVYLGSVSGTHTQLDDETSWTLLSQQFTPPANATQMRVGIYFSSAEPGVPRTMRFDAVHLERVSTFDGMFIVGKVTVPAQTPGIDLTQDPVRATYHEDYRVALNVQPVDSPVEVRVQAQFMDDSNTVLDTQIVGLGSFSPAPWVRTPAAAFRTLQFATKVRFTLQFRNVQPGQIIDIDATEARAFTGGV